MDIVTYKCHVYDSAKGRYNMIMGRDLLTTLGLDPKFSDFIVVGVKWLYEVFSAPTVDVRKFYYESLTNKNVKQEESFLDLYVDECFESGNMINLTWQMCIILDAKYKKEYLNKIITKQCEHLSTQER